MTPALSRARVDIGKKITQWRKLQGRTVATASAAPSMIADLQRQLDAANERIDELEDMNGLLEQELESLRQHEEALEDVNESSSEGANSDYDPQADDPLGDAAQAAVDAWIAGEAMEEPS